MRVPAVEVGAALRRRGSAGDVVGAGSVAAILGILACVVATVIVVLSSREHNHALDSVVTDGSVVTVTSANSASATIPALLEVNDLNSPVFFGRHAPLRRISAPGGLKIRFCPWDYTSPSKTGGFDGVITSRGEDTSSTAEVDGFILPVSTEPQFVLVVPDTANEGVGRDLFRNGNIEAPTGHVFKYILDGRCSRRRRDIAAGRSFLVVDLGANFGYFANYAAAMDCDVLGVEAQPRLIPMINLSFALNGIDAGRVRLVNNIVHWDSTAKLKIKYNQKCWACSYVQGAQEADSSSALEYVVPARTVDSIISKDILLLKIDVEGFEVNALRSAEELLRQRNVENIVMEWSPRMNTHAKITDEMSTAWLHKLFDMGYTIRHYDLRMRASTDGLLLESFEHMGRTWKIPKNRLSSFNEEIISKKTEANLWLTKWKTE